MSQQCVHFHTTKEIDETEDILKKQGMEIIIKSNSATIQFSDLTDEEKKSYILEIEKDVKEHFKFSEKILKEFGMLMKDYPKFEKSIFTSLNLMKKNPGKIIRSKMYDKYSSNMTSLGSAFLDSYHRMQHMANPLDSNLRHSWRRTRISSGSIGTIQCSLLVAKKGDDTVKYLSFMQDPIVTLYTTSKNLKSTLQGKF